MGAMVLTLSGLGLADADVGCTSSSPSSNAYSVAVCITAPSGPLTGAVAATATITTSGTPKVSKVVFYLDSEYVLTDIEAPYAFDLPTTNWVDGTRTLAAAVTMTDGFNAQRANLPVTFNNGILTPPGPSAGSFTPRGVPPAIGNPYVMAAVGDGAGGRARSNQVGNLIASWNPNSFLYLGDVYEKGSASEFSNWYGGVTGDFGRFKAITNPTIGNHEYSTGSGRTYFNYWDNVPHYYSYDAGGWHIVSIDSNTNFNQLTPGTGQYKWLQQDLAARTSPCALVYFHHPRFSAVSRGDILAMDPIWKLMATYGVDVALNAHDHNYQRWVPMNGNGVPSANGVTELVVGTGGQSIHTNSRVDSRLAVQFDKSPNAYGALRMALSPGGLTYTYVNVNGQTLDSGAIGCEEDPDLNPPGPPTDLAAQATSGDVVNLAWSPSTDDVGVAGYDVFRDDVKIGSTGVQTAYVDLTAQPGATYEYYVKARDVAGNSSGESNSVMVTTPTHLFSDDFETGNLSKWTSSTGVSVGVGQGYDNTFGARATSTGPAAYTSADILPARSELYYQFRFKIQSKSSNSVYLMRFRTNKGVVVGGLFLTNSNRVAWRNNIAKVTTTASSSASTGTWHDAQVHVSLSGGSPLTEVWLDGTKLVSGSDALGITPISKIQMGESQAQSGRSFDIVFDDVTLDTHL